MPGRDLSAELYGSAGSAAPAGGGRDLSGELYGAPARAPASAMDRTRAAAAGVNKGFFSDLMGLPVDTAANVLDLAKAGVGTAYQAISGKTAPDWTLPMDRRHVVGAADWIASKLNDVGLGGAINNPHPDDAVSRVLYTGGRVAGTSMSPDPRAKLSAGAQLANAGMGAISGLTSGAVGEVAPEWAGVAGMLPSAAVVGTAAAMKHAVRGGEAGRQAMEQRIQDLANGGITSPSAGLASGNKFFSGLENLLSQTPGAMGLYERAQAANVAGMQAKADALRDSLSTDFGPVAAGSAIQADLKGGFRNRVNATTRALNDKVASLVGADTIVPINATLDRAGQLSTPMKGAEATTGDLIVPRIAQIADNLRTDVYGAASSSTPMAGNPALNAAMSIPGANQSLWNVPSGPVSNPSLWNIPVLPHTPVPQRAQAVGQQQIPNASLWNAQKEQGIPFGALKALRTSIGDEASSPAILGTPEGAQFKQLYGAMSEDMRQAVAGADRKAAGVDVGPLLPGQLPASMALNRANTFYSRAATRAEDLNGIANRDTPEGAYGAVVNSLNSGPSLYEKLRGTLDPATRQKLVSTIVDQLGTAKPGQQTAEGDVWSPRTFLTNYSKLYQNGGGDALFKRLPGGQQQADQLASIAKAAEMLGDSSKVWSNPSGTAHALAARGAVGTIGLGIVGGLFYKPLLLPAAAAGGSMIAANQVSQRLLLNPKFVNWLAKAPNVPPDQAQAYAQRLMATAAITKDPQFQQDATDYLRLVEDSHQ